MTETLPEPQQQLVEATPGRVRSVISRGRMVDLAIMVLFVLAAFWVMSNLWRNLESGYLVNAGRDQSMWEWFFADTAHALSQFRTPLYSDLLNYPLGVNLMANTAMFGISMPLAPLTLLFGPTPTYAIGLTLGLAGTAIAWYWTFSRYVLTGVSVRVKCAAAIGGGFCGFAPAMISHANGHPNFVAFFVIPFIFMQVIRVSRGTNVVRDGVVLGLLMAWQIFLGEEPLLIFTMSAMVFGAVYALSDLPRARAAIKRSLPGLAVGAIVSILITAIPLYSQFFGPASYDGVGHGQAGADFGAFTTLPTESVGGDKTGAEYRMNPTEENSYFGWPIVILIFFATVWLWKMKLTRAAAAVIVVMGVLSLGSELVYKGDHTGITLPWKFLAHLPLFESVLESRFAMGAIPAIGLLLTLGTYRALVELRNPRGGNSRGPGLILPGAWLAVLALAVVVLIPTRIDTVERPDTPKFITSGSWENYVSDGSLVSVPVSSGEEARAMRWQIDADFGFPIAGGYFVGPHSITRGGIYGAEFRPTSSLLVKTNETGQIPVVDATTRADAITDLRFWRADVLVLPKASNDNALRQTVNALVGFDATSVDDVWVWDVRDLVSGKTTNK